MHHVDTCRTEYWGYVSSEVIQSYRTEQRKMRRLYTSRTEYWEICQVENEKRKML